MLVKVFPSKFSCLSLKSCFISLLLPGKMGKNLIFFSFMRIFGVGVEESSKEEEFTARGKIPSNM